MIEMRSIFFVKKESFSELSRMKKEMDQNRYFLMWTSKQNNKDNNLLALFSLKPSLVLKGALRLITTCLCIGVRFDQHVCYWITRISNQEKHAGLQYAS